MQTLLKKQSEDFGGGRLRASREASKLRSSGSLPASGFKTAASPAARRSVLAARSRDFRLPFCLRLLGAMKTVACLQRASTAAAAVLPVILVVIFFVFRVVCNCVCS